MESEAIAMRAEYDFSKAQKNPYAKILKKQITINLDSNTVDYFKAQSEQVGIPYQTLINLYLRDCASNKRQIQVLWTDEKGAWCLFILHIYTEKTERFNFQPKRSVFIFWGLSQTHRIIKIDFPFLQSILDESMI